ncbi:MAG TPA: rhodanese-like domain-containing protein [Opitutaceae bacterium]|nr:rhodanese-like domain-containing protein [Opitutaceae bacterium]
MGSLRKSAALLAIAAVLGGLSVTFNPAARAVLLDALREDEITVADAKALGAAALWIDARSRADFESGHVEGALQLNEDSWIELLIPVIERWQPGMPVVVYCDSQGCQASRKVAERLRAEAGIDSAKVLRGDWSELRPR